MNTSVETLVQTLANLLKERQWTLATAESCTGGGLSYALTSLAGSSDWFERGFITYSNQAKIDLLNLKTHTLNSFGAVSEQTAREMAEGALHHSAATLAISITGIAGPGGGTPEKPVGTVWIGLAHQKHPTDARVFLFKGNRTSIREQAIETALTQLMIYLNLFIN